jgi:hypothetical protein
LGISSVALIESAATTVEFRNAAASGPAVIAFYCHGDVAGRILTQDGEPCWTPEAIPDLSGTAVFAHACRGMCWLSGQARELKARLLVGWECDLKTPANGSDRFWEVYAGVHCFLPKRLATGADDAMIRRDYYEFCTRYIHELNARDARLMEIIAVQESRDDIVFL